MPDNLMMNPRMRQILDLIGQNPSDLMAASVGSGDSTQYVTPDYLYPVETQAAMAAYPDVGYLDLPQDFGGVDNMASITAELRNPTNTSMETNSIPPVPTSDLTSLPDFQNMSGMGLGRTAPESFNMNENSVKQRLINQMLNMMGM